MAFGEILKQKRLEHGWTKEYIAERTNLMTRIIDALESENFKNLQPPPYTRGHIRICCDLLGIEAQPVIDAYMAALHQPASARSVTRPSVHDLPRRPPEPIHTGAHRTFPPKKEEIEADRDPATVPHRLVESAEASFTAVPKPVDVPKTETVSAPAPAPAMDELPLQQPAPVPPPAPAVSIPEETPFTLDSDPAPAQPAPRLTGRAALAELGELAASRLPRREVQGMQNEVPKSASLTNPGRSIFGPQRPVPEPPNPQLDTLCSGASRLKDGLQSLITALTRPKVRRMNDNPEPILNRRVLLRAATVFCVLISLTLLVFAFRYVFKMSEAAEPETMLESPRSETFEPRPVALPPPPYFKVK